ncbi:hypothetical protein B0H11DRAFT_2171961 [Mycena galericulata]|nr:hypothetical protein B0H11DRAFT_2171961 [Mycena galericulata]
MTLTVLLSVFALSLLPCSFALSLLLPDDNSTTPLVASQLPAASVGLPVIQSVALVGGRDAVDTLLFEPGQIIADIPTLLPLDPITSALDISSLYLYPLYSPLPTTDASQSAAPISLVTATEILTDTETVTEPPTTTTEPAAPSTVTDVVTVFISTQPPPPSSTRTTPAPSGVKAAWAAPARMTDLSAFNITAFPGGQQNLKLVDGIPASATASPSAAAASPSPLLGLDSLLQSSDAPSSSSYTPWDNTTTVMQLLYPAHSANPAAKPQGGAEFYASPLAIASAETVTMGYSVFFPHDFDWVKGGKLPGLYGGRTGCSGGDSALDCFSTRLMWRPNCEGEMYLYAPKDKQTAALCADPHSVCDSTYGFSIGRGTFCFQPGGWTTVLQIVRLNTPGKQDGGFWLYVDGQLRIHREDIFYRDVPPASTTKAEAPISTSTSTSDDGGDSGGILDPLLNGILKRRTAVQEAPRNVRPLLLPAPTGEGGLLLASDAREWVAQMPLAPFDPATTVTTTSTVSTTATLYPTLVPSTEQTALRTAPIGFCGIFFSTFFGGHGPAYATSRDQYAWFKDFNLIYNR